MKSRADSGASGARDASLESASLESGGTTKRAHEAARHRDSQPEHSESVKALLKYL